MMKRISRLIFLCAVLALFAAPGWAVDVSTETALKDALNTAGNVINITADITLGSSTSTIPIAQSVTINGNGHTISGGGTCRVFNITAGTVTINDLTIKDGNASGGDGGGINVEGSSANVTVDNCIFTDNTTGSSNGDGGGMCVNNSGTNATVTNCTFTGNTAWGGGGIMVLNGSTATITNCTFTGNKAHGGGMRVFGNNSTATIINCTFVNNTANDSKEIGVGEGGAFEAVNTIFWNDINGTYVYASQNCTLTNCAYGANAASITGTNCVNNLSWSGRTSENVTVNGVKHTVFKLTASDTKLHAGGKTGDNFLSTDQLGVTRSTSKPSIGAVEYITFAVSTTTLPEGTVGTAYNADLKAEFTPAQSNAELKWSVTTGNLPDGLAIDGSTISGEPTTAGDYTFTLTAAGSGDVYSIYSADQEFTLKINPKPEVSFDIGTVKITSTGGSLDIALELASKDYSDSAKTSSSDLTSIKNGTLIVLSSDQADVVVTIDPGEGDIAAVLCGSDNVAVTDNKFTPSTVGMYKIIFTGTDDNGNVKYFAAGFAYSIMDDTDTDDGKGIITSEDIDEDVDGNLVVKSGTTISSDFVNLEGDALVAYVDNFFAKSTQLSDSDRATAEDMAEFLEKMGITASDIGDEISGYKIIGAKLGKYISGNRPFLIIMKHTGTDRIFLGLGVTQLRSNVLSIKFDILQKAVAIVTDEKLSFPRGRYRVGATDAKEYLAKATISSIASKVLSKVDTAAETEEDGIGSIYLGEFELAAANYTQDDIPSGDDDTDTDTDDESEVDPEAILETSRHGSSGGCNAGFGLFALAALALAYRKFSK